MCTLYFCQTLIEISVHTHQLSPIWIVKNNCNTLFIVQILSLNTWNFVPIITHYLLLIKLLFPKLIHCLFWSLIYSFCSFVDAWLNWVMNEGFHYGIRWRMHSYPKLKLHSLFTSTIRVNQWDCLYFVAPNLSAFFNTFPWITTWRFAIDNSICGKTILVNGT